jgi:hypothetical protein
MGFHIRFLTNHAHLSNLKQTNDPPLNWLETYFSVVF